MISPLKALTGLTLVYLERLILEQLTAGQQQSDNLIALARQGLAVRDEESLKAFIRAQQEVVSRGHAQAVDDVHKQARLHRLYLEHIQILSRDTTEGLNEAFRTEKPRQAA